MANALRAGDTFTAQWSVGENLGDATAVIVLQRRFMGELGDERVLIATVTPGDTASTISAVLPADLAPGDYAVRVRASRGNEVVTAPSMSSRSLTVWP